MASLPGVVSGSWIINVEERAQYDQQFAALRPVNGFITGEQAKGVLMKSGLGVSVLAHIWDLADVNRDGKMDKWEFAIAMYLIDRKSKGFEIPATLPPSLLPPSAADTVFGAAPFEPRSFTPTASFPSYQSFTLPLANTLASPAVFGNMASTFSSTSLLSLNSWDTAVGGATPMVPPRPLVPAVSDNFATMHSSRSTATSPSFCSGGSGAVRLPDIKPETRTAYIQAFNALDKRLTGYVSGIQARNEFGRCGLSKQVLAQIWALSDLDQDGRLSLDEYILARHYIDAVKAGESLPRLAIAASSVTPRTLPSRRRNFSLGSLDGSEASVDSMEEPKFSPAPLSFEDKRRENFEKGQAELERRRQQLFKQEQREREERERKEREEAERKEREREEMERRRQLQYEREMNRKKEEQLKLEEEYRRRMEQKEAARRELERQKQIEWEKMRVHELMMQRQSEQESLCHVKQTHKNLSFQLQALQERSDEVVRQIETKRGRIFDLTQSIDGMKEERNAKLADMERLKKAIDEINEILSKVRQEKVALLSKNPAPSDELSTDSTYRQYEALCSQKKSNVEKLCQHLAVIDNEINQAMKRGSECEGNSKLLKRRLATEQADYDSLLKRFNELRAQLGSSALADSPLTSVPSKATASSDQTTTAPSQDDVAAVDHKRKSTGVAEGTEPTAEAVDMPETAKYRALYEFIARSEDELSFQPGDTIVVFKNHVGEPGWLAGQIKEKVGWFPEAFATCVEDNQQAVIDENGTTSQQQQQSQHQFEQKLEAINEESFEREELTAKKQSVTVATSSSLPSGTSSTAAAVSRVPAHALYNWKAKTENHLTFNKGDLINVLEMQEMWWKGETADGQVGWFPKSYVSLESEGNHGATDAIFEAAAASATSNGADTGFEPNTSEGTVMNPSATTANGAQTLTDTAAAMPLTTTAQTTGVWYVALYSFVASEPGDLPFRAGDKILVVQKDSDWWTGRIGDVEGIFPANYVARCNGDSSVSTAAASSSAASNGSPTESVLTTGQANEFGRAIAPFSPSDSNQLALELGDVVKIRTKSPTGWWEGELQKNNGTKRLGWFPGTYVKIISEDEGMVVGNGGEAKTPVASKGQQQQDLVEALFDYAPQQGDELELKRGDVVAVVEKLDSDWWVGRLTSNGRQGLFPANYVQTVSDVNVRSSLSDRTSLTSDARKRSMYFQELVCTEKNYTDDLVMVRDVFQRPLVAGGALSDSEANAVFVNWNRLIQLSRRLYDELVTGGEHRVGAVLLANVGRMKLYLNFCKRQLAAVDLVEEKERTSATFRAIHTRCCQDENARGLPLSYFILFPVTRLTKYPLMLREMLKYTPTEHADYQDLAKAVEAMRALCDDVNRLTTQIENARMLTWCQNHVRCDTISPSLLFNGVTNHLGPRQFLHAGIVYKAKSNRLLVAFLFNDLLMLTVPDEAIPDALSFKLTRTSALTFTMYKLPLVLDHCHLLKTPLADHGLLADDEAFALHTNGDATLCLRAVTSNAKLMWIKRLESALNQAHANQKVTKSEKTITTVKEGIGRLLIELVQTRNLPIPNECKNCSILAELCLGDSKQLIAVDQTRSDVLCSTQFIVQKIDVSFDLNLYVHLPFAPDLLIGHAQLMFEDMMKMSGLHRNPVLKQLMLSDDATTDIKFTSHVIIKFVVHMFDI